MIKCTTEEGTIIEGSVDEIVAFIKRMTAITTYPSDDELKIYGQPVKKVKGPARQGDFIVYRTAPYSFLTEGVPYLVKAFDEDDGSVIITDEDGDYYHTRGDDFSVYRIKGKE